MPTTSLLDALSWPVRCWRQAAPAVSLITLCSCVSFPTPSAASRPAARQPVAAARISDTPLQPTYSLARPAPATLGPVGGRTALIQTVSATRAGGSFAPGAAPTVSRSAVRHAQWCPPQDREAANPFDASAAMSQAELAREYPDEYLFDGGDRRYPAQFEQLEGLDPEDAVAEYVDDAGPHVLPSNRVAVYSPRFAAITSFSASSEGVNVGTPNGTATVAHGLGLRNRQATTAHEQRDQTQRVVTRLRGSGFAANEHLLALELSVGGRQHDQALQSFEGVGFIHTGTLETNLDARLLLGIQSAAVWTRNQNPVVMGQLESAGQVESRFEPKELVGREIKLKPGRLRIVKLADRKVALPGEVVTFTIRFDNSGDLALREVVILDNLTPRLEYVDDSATCDRPGRLVTLDNGQGSLILRWELDEPLNGHSGGVVTFQAKVH